MFVSKRLSVKDRIHIDSIGSIGLLVLFLIDSDLILHSAATPSWQLPPLQWSGSTQGMALTLMQFE